MKQIPPPPPAGAVSQKNHALRRERRAEIKQSGLRLRRGRYRRKTMLSGEKEERKINKAVPAPAGAVAKRQGGPMLRQTEKFKSTAIDMTSGPILGQLVAFALPLMLGNVFQMLYNTVDSVIVGNFVSKQALAAIGSTTMIVNMLVFFFNGFSTGAVVTIGQFYGAQKLDKLHRAVETTMAATFLLSLVFTVAGVLSVKPLLRMMSTPEDVFEDATVYLRIYIGGISGLLVYNIGSGILRAVGDSKRPLYFLILTSLINIVLDLLFVVVLKTGIAGAAVATILSQFLSAALILLLLTKTKDIYRLDWKELKLDGLILGKIFAIGMPAGIQSVLTAFSNIFVQSYINSFGSDCMAGWSSYNKLDQFIMLPMQSMAIASTTFVSQNVGAGNDRRADRGTVASLLLTCGITGVIIALLVGFAPASVRLFSPDEAVIAYGVLFIRTNVVFLLFNCINHVLAGALRGRGDSKAPMIIMLSTFVGLRQVYLYVVTHYIANTPKLVGFGYPVGWVSCCVIEIIYYVIRRRKREREQIQRIVLTAAERSGQCVICSLMMQLPTKQLTPCRKPCTIGTLFQILEGVDECENPVQKRNHLRRNR